MDEQHPDLAAKVRAVNQAHAAAKQVRELLYPVFEKLVGCQVMKAHHRLLAKVKKLLPELPKGPGLEVVFYSSERTLGWLVRAGDSGGVHFMSYEIVVYLADIGPGGVVTRLYEKDSSLRTDYTVEGVLEKRAAYKLAEQAYSDARSAMFPFSEYDR